MTKNRSDNWKRMGLSEHNREATKLMKGAIDIHIHVSFYLLLYFINYILYNRL